MFRFKLVLIVHFLSVCVVSAVASGEHSSLPEAAMMKIDEHTRHGRLPRMSDQLNAGTISETTWKLKTIHTIHSLKADMIRMIKMAKWYSGNHGDLKLPGMSYREENSKRTSSSRSVPTGIEPGPTVWQERMLPFAPQRRTAEFSIVKFSF